MIRFTSDDSEYTTKTFNTFFAKDGEGYVRAGGEDNQDISLPDWIKKAAKNIGAEISSTDVDGFDDEMYGNLQYGIETPEGVLAYLYLAAGQAIEMRGRLKKIEDILGDEYNLEDLRRTLESVRSGKCVVLDLNMGDTVFYVEESTGEIKESKIGEVFIGEEKGKYYWTTDDRERPFAACEIGTVLFRSREDLENSLRKE